MIGRPTCPQRRIGSSNFPRGVRSSQPSSRTLMHETSSEWSYRLQVNLHIARATWECILVLPLSLHRWASEPGAGGSQHWCAGCRHPRPDGLAVPHTGWFAPSTGRMPEPLVRKEPHLELLPTIAGGSRVVWHLQRVASRGGVPCSRGRPAVSWSPFSSLRSYYMQTCKH